MTTLRPNSLIAPERKIGLFDGDRLVFQGAEMHLDSARLGVVENDMLKSG
jgi:hypothetical protein